MAVNYKPLRRNQAWSTDQKRVIAKLFGLAETAATTGASTISRSVINRTLAGKLDAGEEQDLRTLFMGLRDAITGEAGVEYTDLTFNNANPDTITTAAADFREFFSDDEAIVVTGSTSNDGTYTIDTVAETTITLISGDTLTAEGTADVTATIYRDGTAYDLQPHFAADRWTGGKRKIIKTMAQAVVDMISIS